MTALVGPRMRDVKRGMGTLRVCRGATPRGCQPMLSRSALGKGRVCPALRPPFFRLERAFRLDQAERRRLPSLLPSPGGQPVLLPAPDNTTARLSQLVRISHVGSRVASPRPGNARPRVAPDAALDATGGRPRAARRPGGAW